MIKNRVLTVAIISALLLLSACSNKAGNTEAAEIDTIPASIKEASFSYAVSNSEYEEDLWINAFDIDEDDVFYIGSFMEDSKICHLSLARNTRDVLCSLKAADYTLSDIVLAGEEKLFVLAQQFNEESFNSSVIALDYKGNILAEYNLRQLKAMPEDWMPTQIEVSNNSVILLGDGHLCAVKFGKQVELLYSLEVNSSALMAKLSNGNIIVGQNEDHAYTLRVLDQNSHKFGAIKSFNTPFISINSGLEWDVYLDDGSSLYGYMLDNNRFEKLLNWNNLGITSGTIAELSDGSLLCSSRKNAISIEPFLRLVESPEKSNTTSKPTTILLATSSAASLRLDIQDAIRQWNIEHPDCQIEIRDYSVYYTGEDERAAELKLAADIASGKIPDIYDFSVPWEGTILSSGQLIRRGMLENLYPYIDKDPALSRDLFFSGVLSSLEINNGLYELVLTYDILTSFALSSDVGAEDSWTYDALDAVVAGSSYYTSLFTTHDSRLGWLQMAIDASGDKLVNWSNGKCYFNSDYFIDVLQAANNLSKDAKIIEGGYIVSEDMKSGTGLLYLTALTNIWNVSSAASVYGEQAAFVGLPEIGNIVHPSVSFGISSYSQHKEECWQFLRQFILGSDANAVKFEFSMRRDVEQSHIEAEIKMAQDQNYIKNHPFAEISMYKFFDILENVKTVSRHDPQVWEIVQSEANAYFAGDKSAEQTAESIQSRVSLYMAEQS